MNTSWTRRERLLLTALKNCIRMQNARELFEDQATGHVSDEEFNAELNENEDLYTVTLDGTADTLDMLGVVDIMREVEDLREFSVDDVQQLFSFGDEQFAEKLHQALKPDRNLAITTSRPCYDPKVVEGKEQCRFMIEWVDKYDQEHVVETDDISVAETVVGLLSGEISPTDLEP